MRPKINALVVGAGRFGINYVRILARLNDRHLPGVPRIDRLIVSRTSKSGAEAVIDRIKGRTRVSAESIIPVKVSNAEDLQGVILAYRPGFTAIVARDPKDGDSVHSRYADIALSCGAVLSEKPFIPATGDGASLTTLEAIVGEKHPNPLGLELPLAAVGQQLWLLPPLRRRIENAGNIRFHWEAAVRGDVSLVDDLVLHPWSLLPPFFRFEVKQVVQTPDKADIRLLLTHRHHGRSVPCHIRLVKGGRQRWLSLDRITLSFQSHGTWLRVWQHHDRWPHRIQEVLAIDNPLEQHIVAALRRRPLIGIAQIKQSQQLLECLQGYPSQLF